MFKSCSVYRKPRGFYIFTYMRTPYGGVGRPPVTKLPSTTLACELGTIVLQLLHDSSGEVTDVDLGKAMAQFRDHLKELGFRNVAAFEKGARETSVEHDGEFYEIVSTRKDKHDMNVSTGSKKLATTMTPQELGNAILDALGDRAFKPGSPGKAEPKDPL